MIFIIGIIRVFLTYHLFAFLLLVRALSRALALILGGTLDDLETGVLLDTEGYEPKSEANRVLVKGGRPYDGRAKSDLAPLSRREYVEEYKVSSWPKGLVKELGRSVVRESSLPLHPGVVDSTAGYVLPAA